MNKVLSIWMLFATFCVFAQNEELYEHGLDQDKWQDIRDGIRYEGQEEGPGREWTYESNEDYNRERERYERNEGGGGSGNGNGNGGNGDGSPDRGNSGSNGSYSPPPSPPQNSFDMPSFSGLGVFGWIMIVVFAGLLVFLIYYLFINAERKGPKIKGAIIDFDEINPTEIPLTELQRLLQEAIENGDYRGAVRIYFIFIVRDLAQKNWIKWEKEKTNFDYLREMSGKNEFEDFNIAVSYFEIIWYGKREIKADKFEKVKPKFTRFLDKLGVK